jgi:hypothetical protein
MSLQSGCDLCGERDVPCDPVCILDPLDIASAVLENLSFMVIYSGSS